MASFKARLISSVSAHPGGTIRSVMTTSDIVGAEVGHGLAVGLSVGLKGRL